MRMSSFSEWVELVQVLTTNLKSITLEKVMGIEAREDSVTDHRAAERNVIHGMQQMGIFGHDSPNQSK